MDDTLKSVSLVAFAIAMAMAMPAPLAAEGDFVGVWQPYSNPVAALGKMTVSPDRLSFEAGASSRLEPVRKDGSVFRLVGSDHHAFVACHEGAQNYVAFRILDNGLLARLYYSADAPPPEPTGNDVMDVTRNGACSVMFYAP